MEIAYDHEDRVELVEVPHDAGRGDEATLDGVELTWRFMNDAIAELQAEDYRGEPEDSSSFRFEAGFRLNSTGARVARDLDPDAGEDDPRSVCGRPFPG